MTATQTQIRRDTATVLNATTPANAELAYDETNKRLRLGDGVTVGGTITPNATDLQTGVFTYAVAGGTANAITLTLTPALTGYASGVGVRFRASANNTGSVTVAINGNSANTIQKMTISGLIDLEGGEIMTNGIYDIVYNGTNFVLMNVAASSESVVEFVGRFNAPGSTNWDINNIFEAGYNYELDYTGIGVNTNNSRTLTVFFSSNGGSSYISNSLLMATINGSSSSSQDRAFSKFTLNDPAESGVVRLHNVISGSNLTTSFMEIFRFGGNLSTVGVDSIRMQANSGAQINSGYVNIWRKRAS